MLELETNTFEQKLSELLTSDAGKFVLIKEDRIIGIFVAMEDALVYGYEKYLDQPFFVNEILPTQESAKFFFEALEASPVRDAISRDMFISSLTGCGVAGALFSTDISSLTGLSGDNATNSFTLSF